MANITTKELTALEEQIQSEQVLIKKYRTMAAQCSDPALKSKCESIAGRHQQHYDKLMCHLK